MQISSPQRRGEAVVPTVPPIGRGRYFSIQLIVLCPFNFDSIGGRTTGNDGSSFLIAGPARDQKAIPDGDAAFRSEAEVQIEPRGPTGEALAPGIRTTDTDPTEGPHRAFDIKDQPAIHRLNGVAI